MKFYLVFLKLFVISALLIVSNNNLALADAHNREQFWNQYHSWLSVTFDHGLELTGYVVRSDWLPVTHNATRSAPTLKVQR